MFIYFKRKQRGEVANITSGGGGDRAMMHMAEEGQKYTDKGKSKKKNREKSYFGHVTDTNL